LKVLVSKLVLFDSSIFVDLLRTGRHDEKIDGIDGFIRNSSVVLAELFRGIKGDREEKFFRTLEKNHPILTPTEKNWLESGQVLSKIRIDHGFEAAKLRDLHFDVLIALTARSHGAVLITSNRADFELVQSYRNFALEVW
jgi:predicted nucleic acid-binding protein